MDCLWQVVGKYYLNPSKADLRKCFFSFSFNTPREFLCYVALSPSFVSSLTYSQPCAFCIASLAVTSPTPLHHALLFLLLFHIFFSSYVAPVPLCSLLLTTFCWAYHAFRMLLLFSFLIIVILLFFLLFL